MVQQVDPGRKASRSTKSPILFWDTLVYRLLKRIDGVASVTAAGSLLEKEAAGRLAQPSRRSTACNEENNRRSAAGEGGRLDHAGTIGKVGRGRWRGEPEEGLESRGQCGGSLARGAGESVG